MKPVPAFSHVYSHWVKSDMVDQYNRELSSSDVSTW